MHDETACSLDWTRMTRARRSLALTLVLATGLWSASAVAGTDWRLEEPYRVAAADCSGAARRAASQTGGQVLSVSTRNQGGQTVCVVTVLVPGKGDERPRKRTITIKP